MPTYISTCHTCDTPYDYIRKVADRHDTPECCGTPTVMGLTTPAIGAMSFSGHKGFHVPDGKHNGKGTWIESGQDYKRYMSTNKLMPASEAAAEAVIQKKNTEAADDKKRRAAVIKAVTNHAP